MASPVPSRSSVRFGTFEVDLNSGELRRKGHLVRVQEQPFRVLAALLEQPGEVVTREQLRERLWSSDTFVDFEHSVNAAIKKLRQALHDDPDRPRFIETIPKRGYRLIAPIESAEATSRPARTWAPRWLAMTVLAGLTVTVASGLRSRPSPSTEPIRSIAVLPLLNLSSDPEQEYFSDGMTDELITDLAKLGGMKVISHTSVERYKHPHQSLPEIARELGVDAVVEGRVMRKADRVRISAQLIDARSDAHLWAESYERDIRDTISLQDEVARRIAAEVGVKISGPQARTKPRSVSPAAHEAYLRGDFYWNKLNCDGFSRALGYFQQAAALEPEYALAYLGIGKSYFTLGNWGCRPQSEAFPQSKAAILKAIELDPSIGAAHGRLGQLYFFDWDWAKAEAEFKLASQLDPSDAATHLARGVFLVSTGRPADGLAEVRRAHELDPTAEVTNLVEGYALYLARHYEEAIQQEKRTIELYPFSYSGYHWLGMAYEASGQYQKATDAYVKSEELRGDNFGDLQKFREAAQKTGPAAYWQRELERTLKGSDRCWLPVIYGHMGETQKQLEALNDGYRWHCRALNILKVDPAYDALLNDPRFRQLIARMRL